MESKINFYCTLALAIGLWLTIPQSKAQELARAGMGGFIPVPVTQALADQLGLEDIGGFYIQNVFKKGTGTNVGLQAGDILIAINDFPVNRYSDFGELPIQKIRGGDEVHYTVLRNGTQMVLSGIVETRPVEQSVNHDVIYDHIEFKGGLVRTIINKPKGKGPFPAVLFIQGYNCQSIDNPGPRHPYRLLAQQFANAGIAFMRVEKPGIGDCLNTPNCYTMDFNTEMDCFLEALKAMSSYAFVEQGQIFLFGHSMGGYLAPQMARSVNVAGIAVYGTGHLPWREYLLQMLRFQLPRQNLSYKQTEARMLDFYKILYALLVENKPPEMIAAMDPSYGQLMQMGLMWDGNDFMFGRHYKALLSVDKMNATAAWAQFKGKVLSIFGTADFQAVNDASHREIVNIVNRHNPGHARYWEASDTDHSFIRTGSMEETVRLSPQEYTQLFRTGFNTEIAEEIIQWIKNKP